MSYLSRIASANPNAPAAFAKIRDVVPMTEAGSVRYGMNHRCGWGEQSGLMASRAAPANIAANIPFGIDLNRSTRLGAYRHITMGSLGLTSGGWSIWTWAQFDVLDTANQYILGGWGIQPDLLFGLFEPGHVIAIGATDTGGHGVSTQTVNPVPNTTDAHFIHAYWDLPRQKLGIRMNADAPIEVPYTYSDIRTSANVLEIGAGGNGLEMMDGGLFQLGFADLLTDAEASVFYNGNKGLRIRPGDF